MRPTNLPATVLRSFCVAAAAVAVSASAQAASPSAEQALKLQPTQKDADVARPGPEEAAKCKISPHKVDGHVGWVVQDAAGVTLRKFLDTNGDNMVDLWSYYKDALEVYRDVDADRNGKVDQCRWFHTGGSRWGLDEDQDGKIDSWKTISAEEVSAEVVAAVAGRDAQRFARLVLTPRELGSLGLGAEKAAQLGKKIDGLAAGFAAATTAQRTLPPDSQWVQFSATRPGVVPAGTDGSSKDLRVYENVMAIVQAGEKHVQVHTGTLVQVGQTWRVIDLPQVVADGQTELASSGFFFRGPSAAPSVSAADGADAQTEKLLAELEKLDQTLDQTAQPSQRSKLMVRRIELLGQIADRAGDPRDRALWTRQLIDMIRAEVHSGACQDGAQRLQALFEKLQDSQADRHLAPYARFVQISVEHYLALQAKDPNYQTIQEDWLKSLDQYVAKYPTGPDTAEAMLQLAIGHEFAGREDVAKQWYGKVVGGFADSAAGLKAAGARTRLDSVGKTITITGKSTGSGTIDLAKYRGRIVLVQYWATWCEPAKADMATLKELLSKHGRSLSIIGVSLDATRKDLLDYLAENKLPWPQIFEEGGLDSRPANQLGILTLPTMILIDAQGKVVNRNVQTTELDAAIKKLLADARVAGRR